MKKPKSTFWPTLTLLLLAPFFGEVLSGSAPPAEFFQPITFFLLVALYGCGAVLVRELARHWKLNWIGVMLLGMAYGIYEEGLAVRSFFDPTWMDLGVLGSYGRWLGVNWIWSIALTLFHSVVSISIPIQITELLFPAQREKRWLGKGGVIVCCLFFFGFVLLAPFFSSHFRIAGVLACIFCMLGLLFAARNWPEASEEQRAKPAAKPFRVGISMLPLMLGLIVGMYGFPVLELPAWSSFLFLALLPWLGFWRSQHQGCYQWGERQAWAAMLGLLSPWLLLAFSAEVQNAARPDDTSGMSLMAGLTCLFLLWLYLLIRKREKDAALS